MRIIFNLLLFFSFILSMAYSAPSNLRRGNGSGVYKNRVEAQVRPNKIYGDNIRSNIGVSVVALKNERQVQKQYPTTHYKVRPSSPKTPPPLNNYNIKPSHSKLPYYYSSPQNSNIKVNIVPPASIQQEESEANIHHLNVKIYPPHVSNQGNSDQLQVDVGQSRPITYDMMFEKTKPYKQTLPPRQKKVEQLPPPPPSPVNEYEDDDVEPLFIQNRNGVLLGFGIGGNFDRLWLSNNSGNLKLYDNSFTYYVRLGYQYYFKEFLGVRAYTHLGDWSNEFSQTIFDGERNILLEARGNVNYSFFAEFLYDFLVLPEHSVGIFTGLGLGIGTYEFGNDETEAKKEIFAIPMFSAGLAYTFVKNNRFEFEVKTPLRQPVINSSWRSEFSTWMIGVSYSYIF